MWDDESEDILERRVGTLIENQNQDGGWGFVQGEESDTLCTSKAIRALSAWTKRQGGDPLSSSVVTDGIRWLKKGVHADGGYGSKERIESSVDMTAYALLSFIEAGLGPTDEWVTAARDFLLRLQRSDGGFPINRRGGSHISTTALAIEALMAAETSQSVIEEGSAYLGGEMISDGNFTFVLNAIGGTGTYDLRVDTGYVIDCSPRGYEFWGSSWDDSIIAIIDVNGSADNMTLVLRIERGRLVLPTNKQKIAIALSHDMWPDTGDWWILNAGNPHTAGQGRRIDDPNFHRIVVGAYTYLTITNLQVPDEYEFFTESEDWVLAIVGESTHPIQDNPGRGYLIGYWNQWMKAFYFSNILAWRAVGSPRINRVCLDLDSDVEFDDRRLTVGDTVTVNGREWELGIVSNGTAVNLSFFQTELNFTRYYYPFKYDITTSIPESASGLYHFGVISVYNKPSFSKDYKVILRDSVEEGKYDEAYIWNGTHWNFFPEGSTWNESGTLWVIGIVDDFLILTRKNAMVFTGLSGRSTVSLVVEGDFIEVDFELHGPKEISLIIYYGSQEVDRGIFDGSSTSRFRIVFGVWGGLRETSRVYRALTLAEYWFTGEQVSVVHNTADLCQQAIKFNKVYNSVIEDKLNVHAWYKQASSCPI